MGEMKQERYDVEFIKRTQNLINSYHGEYDFTLFMNCLLGLIILPNEFYGRRKLSLFNKDLSTFPELKNIIASSDFVFDPTKWDSRSKSYIPDKKTLKVLLKKIRNGIAHQRIESINEDGKWTGVIIQDINKKNNNNVELSIKFQIKEFRIFAIFISSKYIDEIERLGKKKSKKI